MKSQIIQEKMIKIVPAESVWCNAIAVHPGISVVGTTRICIA